MHGNVTCKYVMNPRTRVSNGEMTIQFILNVALYEHWMNSDFVTSPLLKVVVKHKQSCWRSLNYVHVLIRKYRWGSGGRSVLFLRNLHWYYAFIFHGLSWLHNYIEDISEKICDGWEDVNLEILNGFTSYHSKPSVEHCFLIWIMEQLFWIDYETADF